MKVKKIRSQDARRALRSMWRSAKVKSHADGTIRIRPEWIGSAGVFTRMHAANMVAYCLNIRRKNAIMRTIVPTPEMIEYRDSVDDGCKWPDCGCIETNCCEGMEDLCCERSDSAP